MNEISLTEKNVLELRQIEGYTIEETIKKADISRNEYRKIIDKLLELGLYDKEEVKKAAKRKKQREYYHKHKKEPKLSSTEEDFRKKCIDVLCIKYFDYNETKQFNPILVSKLGTLHNLKFSYEIIYNTILYAENNLDYANKKVFSSELQKINYMIAIIKNNLKVVTKRIERSKAELEGFDKKVNDEDLVHQLNKTIISKPSSRIDMSKFLN